MLFYQTCDQDTAYFSEEWNDIEKEYKNKRSYCTTIVWKANKSINQNKDFYNETRKIKIR